MVTKEHTICWVLTSHVLILELVQVRAGHQSPTGVSHSEENTQ